MRCAATALVAVLASWAAACSSADSGGDATGPDAAVDVAVDVTELAGDPAAEAPADVQEIPEAGLTRLHAAGTKIVDAAGREVRLRGVNLGGWMFHETWITLVGQTSAGALYQKAVELGVGDDVRAVLHDAGTEYGDDPAVTKVCPGNGDLWVAKVHDPLVAKVGAATAQALFDELTLHPPLCDDADLGLRQLLSKRFGDDARDQLLDAFQGAWITEADIAWLAGQGFNVVRVPIGYRSLVRGPDVDKPTGLDWNPLAFQRLSDLLDACAKHGVYAVIDIQEAPGGQNSYAGKSGLFDDPKMQDLAVQLWEHLSDVLHDRDEVAAYSLLAEPYGAPNADTRDAMYDRIVKAVRAKGDTHLCVIHDGFMGMGTLPVPAKFGWTDVVYSTHLFEWNADTYEYYDTMYRVVYEGSFTQAQAAQGVPYYLGSFATFRDADWAYGAAGLVAWWMDQHAWSWSLWTYKRPDDPLSKTVFDWSTSWGLRGRLQGEWVRPDPYVDDLATLKARFLAYRDLVVAPNEALLAQLKNPQPRP